MDQLPVTEGDYALENTSSASLSWKKCQTKFICSVLPKDILQTMPTFHYFPHLYLKNKDKCQISKEISNGKPIFTILLKCALRHALTMQMQI